MPSRGYCVVYGTEEVFAAGIEDTIQKMKAEGARVKVKKGAGGVHAWPVVDLFLGCSKEERLRGVDQIADMVVSRMRAVQILETPKRKKTKEEADLEAYPSPKTPPPKAPTPSKWSPLSYLGH